KKYCGQSIFNRPLTEKSLWAARFGIAGGNGGPSGRHTAVSTRSKRKGEKLPKQLPASLLVLDQLSEAPKVFSAHLNRNKDITALQLFEKPNQFPTGCPPFSVCSRRL
ncbi:MAG: hypothetical protein V2I51_12235, partial [Anderseniella sp.]|nr:hypothetical protein [Anderseniella sp.]